MTTISIEVEPEIAKAYQAANLIERKKCKLFSTDGLNKL